MNEWIMPTNYWIGAGLIVVPIGKVFTPTVCALIIASCYRERFFTKRLPPPPLPSSTTSLQMYIIWGNDARYDVYR